MWVDSFGRKYRDAMPPAAVELLAPHLETLDRIRARSGRMGGARDIFAWRGTDYLFIGGHLTTNRSRQELARLLE